MAQKLYSFEHRAELGVFSDCKTPAFGHFFRLCGQIYGKQKNSKLASETKSNFSGVHALWSKNQRPVRNSKLSLQLSQNGATKLVPRPSSWPENFFSVHPQPSTEWVTMGKMIALNNHFLPIDQLESLVQNGEPKIGQKPRSEGPDRNFR